MLRESAMPSFAAKSFLIRTHSTTLVLQFQMASFFSASPFFLVCAIFPRSRVGNGEANTNRNASHFTATSTIWLEHMPMQRHHVSLFLKGESEEEEKKKFVQNRKPVRNDQASSISSSSSIDGGGGGIDGNGIVFYNLLQCDCCARRIRRIISIYIKYI